MAKKIKITLTMTEQEAEWFEQFCFVEDEFAWTKFINRIGKIVRIAREKFQLESEQEGNDGKVL